MRPNTDYKKNYSASVKKGGGLIFDSIHEIDYLNFYLEILLKFILLRKKFLIYVFQERIFVP